MSNVIIRSTFFLAIIINHDYLRPIELDVKLVQFSFFDPPKETPHHASV